MTAIKFNREVYFDMVRGSLFGGSMNQGQVDGQEAILTVWEIKQPHADLRNLAYPLATTLHETASTMLPIEEYGKGQGHEYGEVDPQTKQTYYGRGFVQLTWRDNYALATKELELEGDDDLEWHAERALDPRIAAAVMFRGMYQGWFRPPNALPTFFSDVADDPYGAREIINGDKHHVPSWSNGVEVGKLIAGYHECFLAALTESSKATEQIVKVDISISTPPGVDTEVSVNGEPIR